MKSDHFPIPLWQRRAEPNHLLPVTVASVRLSVCLSVSLCVFVSISLSIHVVAHAVASFDALIELNVLRFGSSLAKGQT